MSEEVRQFVGLVQLAPGAVEREFVFYCPKCKRNTWHVLRALQGRRFDMCGICGTYTDDKDRKDKRDGD